jgi:hypothetical protein
MNEVSSEALSEFVKAQKQKLHKCLEPFNKCENQAIQAHSIQNSRTIDLVQEKGKVWMMRPRVDANGPRVELQLVGRNQASTFTGFCSYHDAEMFRPIDTQDVDPANPEHLFLLAYRSVSREYHAIMEGAVRNQTAIQKAVEDGRSSAEQMSPEMLIATEGLMRAYGFYRYRVTNFDIPYTRRNFDSIDHDVIVFDDQDATIAASTFYSLEPIIRDAFTGIIINVVPTPGKRVLVIFSYAKQDTRKARSSLDRVLTLSGPFQRYELSKVLLTHTENFIIGPRFVATWSDPKRDAIVQAFRKTINASLFAPALTPDIGENPDYMLF